MENFIIIAIVTVIAALAATYIYKAKKNGKKCIGCPHECVCHSKSNQNSCSCYNTNSSEMK